MFTHRFLRWTAPLVAAVVLAFTPALGTAKPRGGGGHHATGHSGGHAAVHSGGHHAAVHSGGHHAAVHHAAVHSGGHRAPAHYGAHSARAYRGGTSAARAYRGGAGAARAYHGGYSANRGYYGRGAYGRGYYGRGYYGNGYYGNGYYGGGDYGGYGWEPWLGYGLGYPYAYGYGPYVNNYYDVSPSTDYVVPDAADVGPAETFSAAPTSAPAELNVILPADGTVAIGSFQTAQAAGAHLYETPVIAAGSPYTYTIQARWMDNGQPVTRTKTVRFQAGDTIDVDFTTP